MNNVERFKNTMTGKQIDRLPVIEWATWWNQTLDRWYQEGLPKELTDPGEIRAYFGLDSYRQIRVFTRADTCPRPAHHGAGIVRNIDEYLAIKPHLYPKHLRIRPALHTGKLASWAQAHEEGRTVVWMTLNGHFWYPRTLLGIQRHLLAFYDDPELMHVMNRDLLEYQLWAVDEICEICTPDFATFAEDMSYNHGSMVSKECYDEFLAPYYHAIIPKLKEHGIVPIIDSDGDVTELISWLKEVGMEGILPLERMAGVDVSQIRESHPTFKMIGAFDKTVMHLGEGAIRQEFERLMPVMASGRFIPAVDHQTPPGVSLEQYRLYVSLLKEYCAKVVQ